MKLDLGEAGTLTLWPRVTSGGSRRLGDPGSLRLRTLSLLSSSLGRWSQWSSMVSPMGLTTMMLVTGLLTTLTGLCLASALAWAQQSQRRAKSPLVLMMQGMTRR